MDFATEHDHREVITLLTPVGNFGAGQGGVTVGRPVHVVEGSVDLWEAEPDVAVNAADEATLAAVRAVQMQISGHEATTSDEDWSDVVIDIPVTARRRASGARGRRTVVFRRLKDDRTNGIPRADRPARRASLTLPDLEDAMVALDMSRGPDEILGTMTLAQIVRGTDASRELRSCLSRSTLFNMTANAFLADSDGETRFCQVPGIHVNDYLELSDLINAFTILVYREANHDRSGQPWRTTDSSTPLSGPDAAGGPAPSAADPDEVLYRTTLAQIIVVSDSSPALRKAMLKSNLFEMTAGSFLIEDDAERKFCSNGPLSVKGFLELNDLVNAYTVVLHRRSRN